MKSGLMDVVVFNTVFMFGDIYGSMDERQKSKIDTMTEEELNDFLIENFFKIDQDMQDNIMDTVAGIIIDRLKWPGIAP